MENGKFAIIFGFIISSFSLLISMYIDNFLFIGISLLGMGSSFVFGAYDKNKLDIPVLTMGIFLILIGLQLLIIV